MNSQFVRRGLGTKRARMLLLNQLRSEPKRALCALCSCRWARVGARVLGDCPCRSCRFILLRRSFLHVAPRASPFSYYRNTRCDTRHGRLFFFLSFLSPLQYRMGVHPVNIHTHLQKRQTEMTNNPAALAFRTRRKTAYITLSVPFLLRLLSSTRLLLTLASVLQTPDIR